MTSPTHKVTGITITGRPGKNRLGDVVKRSDPCLQQGPELGFPANSQFILLVKVPDSVAHYMEATRTG